MASIPRRLPPSLSLIWRRCCGRARQLSLGFEDERVQNYLWSLNGTDFNKIFPERAGEESIPTYTLMSEKELKKTYNEMVNRCKELLTPPPVLSVREEGGEEILTDNELKDFDDTKWVFTDITMGIDDKDRYIVVREVSGKLRQATAAERDRLCQTFMPKPGCKIWLPTLLTEEELPHVLERGHIKHSLDVACVQCPPNSPDYIRVHQTVYDYVDRNGLYDALHSTKHYGGLVWHLIKEDNLNGIIYDMVKNQRLEDVSTLIELYQLVRGDNAPPTHTGEELVKTFCEHKGYTEVLHLLEVLREAVNDPQEGTGDPQEVTGDPQEGTGDPQEVTGDPQEVTDDPQEVTDDPQEGTGDPQEVTGDPQEGTGDPQEVTGDPQEVTDDPQEGTGDPQEGTGDPKVTG